MTDLFALTAELVDVASESRQEAALVAIIEERLRSPGKTMGTGQEPAIEVMAQNRGSS